MAKLAKVYGIKVFQGQTTSTAAIVAGVDAAIDHILDNDHVATSVINMSLGGAKSKALDDAVGDITSHGIVAVVAAGNEAQDVANVSPARAPSAITVGAVNDQWNMWVSNLTSAVGSNFGDEIDIFGPGQDIISAGIESDTAFDVLSGTSMACPHIAGLVLYAISVDGVSGVKEMVKHIVGNGTPDVVGGPIKDSPNLLANNGNSQQRRSSRRW